MYNSSYFLFALCIFPVIANIKYNFNGYKIVHEVNKLIGKFFYVDIC